MPLLLILFDQNLLDPTENDNFYTKKKQFCTIYYEKECTHYSAIGNCCSFCPRLHFIMRRLFYCPRVNGGLCGSKLFVAPLPLFGCDFFCLAQQLVASLKFLVLFQVLLKLIYESVYNLSIRILIAGSFNFLQRSKSIMKNQ